MSEITMMTDEELFNKEVKELLSGYIADKDTAGYVAIKITRLYERHLADRKSEE